MTPASTPVATGEEPLIELLDIVKRHGGRDPLRVRDLRAGPADRIVLSGLDAAAAETLVHLATGAALPDEGDVRILGRSTRDIPTDTEWLEALDRFGLVSERAVLFEQLPAAASLALPLSLAIDPMPPDVRAQVEALADDVGLARDRLDRPASELAPDERLRIHLARAVAHAPRMLLLEHPTGRLASPAHSRAFGDCVRRISAQRGVGWIAVSNDPLFARASGGRRLTLQASGRIVSHGLGAWRWLRRA